jgi:DNA-binding GntR family transcriptional regulator
MELPQYLRLKDWLKHQILTGIFREGEMLPSETILAQIHGLARATVRQALDELVREGFIRKQQGKGSIVHRRSLGLLSFKGFSEVLAQTDHRVTTLNLVPPRLDRWPAKFFFPLSDEEWGAKCIFIKRLRSVDGYPVMLESTYLPNFGLEEICRKPLIEGSLFLTLSRRFHISPTNLEQDLRAARAAAEAADYLNVNIGDPILQIYRRYRTDREDFYFYSSLMCNTERYSIGTGMME